MLSSKGINETKPNHRKDAVAKAKKNDPISSPLDYCGVNVKEKVHDIDEDAVLERWRLRLHRLVTEEHITQANKEKAEEAVFSDQHVPKIEDVDGFSGSSFCLSDS